MMNHYGIDCRELRIMHNSAGDFAPRALCGNGNGHARLTRNMLNIDCPRCLEMIEDGELVKLGQKPLSSTAQRIKENDNG